MKKVVGLFLILTLIVSSAVFSGCAAKKTTVNVKIVIDQKADGIIDETIHESSLELAGVDPSIDSILTKLDDNGTITVEYAEEDDGTISLLSINNLKVETENTTPPVIHQWNATKNGEDVKGLWSETIVHDGDTIILRYDVWESSIK